MCNWLNFRFVHMDSESAATKAINSLNGIDMKGRRMKVARSIGGQSSGGAERWDRGCNTQKIFVSLRAIFTD